MKTNNRSNDPQLSHRSLSDVGADLSIMVNVLAHTFEDLKCEHPNSSGKSAKLHARASTIVERACQLVDENTARVAQLEELVVTDELTKLLNRRGFLQECERTLALARRYDEQGVLVYIDLDGFKPINDQFGHAAGDKVLTSVAKLLNANVRRSDFVGRIGGDEFAVMIVRSAWDDGAARAQHLETLLKNMPVEWQGRTITLGASCGVHAYNNESRLAQLLHSADHAMYRAKKQNKCQTFPPTPTKRVLPVKSQISVCTPLAYQHST